MPIISGGGGGGASGAAGGDLGGTYPNPTVDLVQSGGTISGDTSLSVGSDLIVSGGMVRGTELHSGFGGEANLVLADEGNDGTGGDAQLFGGGGAQANKDGGNATLHAGDSWNGLHGAIVDTFPGRDTTGKEGFVRIRSNNSTGATGQALVFDGVTFGGAAVVWNTLGAIKCNSHAAPADGVLAAGDLYLWFDQTNGAGKFMVKAKTADGTVVTAAVALA